MEETDNQNVKKGFWNKYAGITILLVLIVAFFLSFILLNNNPATPSNGGEEEINYNGVVFEKKNDLWNLRVRANEQNQIVNFMFHYNPEMVEDISVNGDVKGYVESKDMLYLTTQKDIGSIPVIGMSNIGRVTGTKNKIFNKHVVGALTEPAENSSKSIPIIDCNNATSTTGVMWFKMGNTTSVNLEGNCIIVEGEKRWDVVRASDRLAFELLNIM